MIYSKYEGDSVQIHIENMEDGDPYTVIGAKAFLSCKNVYEVKLPETICEIRDWAFAHMKELKRLIFPAKEISIGKDVFLDCDNLKEVIVYPDESNNPGLAELLATCITILKSNNLLDFKMSSEHNDVWCENYDRELMNYVNQNNRAGFQPVIVGWFNDEGEEEQLQRYIEKVISDKIRLCFLRLKYNMHISDNTRKALIGFLKNRIQESENRDSFSWAIIRDILSEDIQYVKLAISNNLLNEELILELIEYLNENNSSTEIVAYLVLSLNGKSINIDQQFEL